MVRRRFMKLPGTFGGAAEDLERVFQQQYYQELRGQGKSHDEAIRLSDSTNLRLYRDTEGSVYMSSHDMNYVNAQLGREDPAKMEALGAVRRLKNPIEVSYRKWG
jgi:hypothetical protein